MDFCWKYSNMFWNEDSLQVEFGPNKTTCNFFSGCIVFASSALSWFPFIRNEVKLVRWMKAWVGIFVMLQNEMSRWERDSDIKIGLECSTDKLLFLRNKYRTFLLFSNNDGANIEMLLLEKSTYFSSPKSRNKFKSKCCIRLFPELSTSNFLSPRKACFSNSVI